MRRAATSSAPARQRALTISVGVGLTAWALASATPIPADVAAWLADDWTWMFSVTFAAIVAHLGFTVAVSVLTWRLPAWRPGHADESLYCFNVDPPRCSVIYVGCVLFGLGVWFAPAANFWDGYLELPSEGIRLLIPAGLSALAAGLWARWLRGMGRLVIRGGNAVWTDRYVSFPLKQQFVSGHTIVGEDRGLTMCARPAGAPRGEEWRPTQRLGGKAGGDGYREPGLEGSGKLEGAFFASSNQRPRLHASPQLGGDVRRWYRVLPTTLFLGLSAASLVVPPEVVTGLVKQLRYSLHGFAWLFLILGLMLGFVLLLGFVMALVSLYTYWMLDIRWRQKGSVDGVWLWKLLDPVEPHRSMLSRLLLGSHLSDSAGRRVGIGLLFLGVWSLVGLSMAVSALLVFHAVPTIGWIAPVLLAVATVQGVAMTTRRLRVRIKSGLLCIQRAGAWLPVTRVDAEGEAIVLSAGPVRVRAQELHGFAKPRDSSVTASLIWPFCAPASAFLSATSSVPAEADRGTGMEAQ